MNRKNTLLTLATIFNDEDEMVLKDLTLFDLSIHDIVDITIKEREIEGDGGTMFTVKEITIEDIDGHTCTISCFME